MEPEVIKSCIREVLSERASVGPEKHQEHHMWIDVAIPKLNNFLDYRDMRMAQLKRRQEMWEKIKNTAIGVVVVTVVGGLFTALAWVGKVVLIALSHGGVQQ